MNNNTDQNGEKAGYRVILLLVVGLAAFSSAMKELNQVQQLSLEVGQLMAQWSDKIAPAQIPQTAFKQTAAKLETCESKQSAPSVELPWIDSVAREKTTELSAVAPRQPELVHPAKPSGVQIVRLKKQRRIDIDPVQLEVRISTDHDAEPDEEAIPSVLPLNLFKAKSRKHGAIRINPRDREMLLKTVNRSINLRIAG